MSEPKSFMFWRTIGIASALVLMGIMLSLLWAGLLA